MVASNDESDNDAYKDGANVNVFLRLRPMNNLEKSKRSKNCIEVHDGREITVDSPLEGEHGFRFKQVCKMVAFATNNPLWHSEMIY
jgi:hypothetical protein